MQVGAVSSDAGSPALQMLAQMSATARQAGVDGAARDAADKAEATAKAAAKPKIPGLGQNLDIEA